MSSCLIVRRALRAHICSATAPSGVRIKYEGNNTATEREDSARGIATRTERERGLEPREDWVSVRAVNAPWPRERTYSAIIAYHPIRLALSKVLRRVTSSGKKEAVEVWVLNESEARQLCEGTPSPAARAVELA